MKLRRYIPAVLLIALSLVGGQVATAAITEDTPRSQSVSAGGATYSFDWPIWAKTDLIVYVDDTLQTVDSDYTVTFTAGLDAGGSITFASAPAAGKVVTILRQSEQARTTDFPRTGRFDIDALNTQLDKLIAQVQDLQEQVDRATKQEPQSTTSGRTMPDAENGLVLGWSAGDLTNLTLGTGATWDGLTDLASTDSGKGAALVGVRGGGTVQDILGGASVRSMTAYVLSGAGTSGNPWIVDGSAINDDITSAAPDGFTVVIPDGYFKLDEAITQLNASGNDYGINLIGTGRGRCVLMYDGSGYAIRIGSIKKEASNNTTRFTLRGFTLDGEESTTPDGGIDVRGSFLVQLSNITIKNFSKSTAVMLNATNTFNLLVSDLHIYGTQDEPETDSIGIRVGCEDLDGTQTAWAQTEVSIRDSLIQMVDTGIAIGNWGNDAGAGHVENILIEGNGIGNIRSAGIDVQDTGAAALTGININSNHFEIIGRPTTAGELLPSYGIYAEEVSGLYIGNNYFHDIPKSIYVEDSTFQIGINKHIGTPSADYTFPAGSYAVSVQEVTSNSLRGEIYYQDINFGEYDNNILKDDAAGVVVQHNTNLTSGGWSVIVYPQPEIYRGEIFNRLDQTDPYQALRVSIDGSTWSGVETYPSTIAVGWGTAAPGSGTWAKGSRVYNSNPAEAGSTSSKYVIVGWICTEGGTPGIWLEMRTLTGN